MKIVLIVLLMIATEAFACSPIRPPIEKTVELSENIYVGVVVSQETHQWDRSQPRKPGYVEYIVKIEETLKGNEESHTFFRKYDCTSSVRPVDLLNKKFLVFSSSPFKKSYSEELYLKIKQMIAANKASQKDPKSLPAF